MSPKVKAIHSLGFLLENLICQSCCDSFGRNQSIKAHVLNMFVKTEEKFSWMTKMAFRNLGNTEITEFYLSY